MTAAELNAEATRAGFGFLDDQTIPVTVDAARMLSENSSGIGIDIAGGVLRVALDHLPDPAEFTRLEAEAGMPVALFVTTPDIFAVLRQQALSTLPPASPRALGSVLVEAAEADAFEVVLVVGSRPQLRTATGLTELTAYPPLSAADTADVARWAAGTTLNAPDSILQTMVTYAGQRWRTTLYLERGVHAVLARKLQTRAPRLEDLDVPAAVASLSRAESGLVIIAGSANSGRTTTAAALLDRINATRPDHIVTVEHLVEYQHSPLQSLISQRQIGRDVADTTTGLRQAAQLGAGVVFVGTVTTSDEVEAAIAAARAGQLVLMTLDAQSAATAVSQLLSLLPPNSHSQLAEALLAVVHQSLLPTPGGRSRQLVCEVLLRSEATASAITSGRPQLLNAVIDDSFRDGMTTRDRSLAYYVNSGVLDEAVARLRVKNPATYDRYRALQSAAPATGTTTPNPRD